MGRVMNWTVTVPTWVPVLLISAVVGAVWWVAATSFMDWLDPKVKRWLWHRAGLEGDPPDDVDHWLEVGRFQLDLRYEDPHDELDKSDDDG